MPTLSELQPLKGIWIVYFTITIILKLTFLSLYRIPKSLRPLPQWSYRLCLATDAWRAVFQFVADIRLQRAPRLESGKDKDRFVLIQPPELHSYSGVLAPTSIKPVPVAGVWLPAVPGRDARRVVLHFIGGAFVLGSDPSDNVQIISGMFQQHLKTTHTICGQYRLATPQTRFPAAVQDLLTVYHYALSLGISPERIIISGDSAGGNLVLALIRYLETTQSQLPLPGTCAEHSLTFKYSIMPAVSI